ncbi:hypothetical protein [Vulcanococcus limneticus]|jgi:hypothetical protein|uniref:hypothetical protein n=1 Tax=Vulcanococcus limneticus TaxID=2170428 RepID=UPI00398BC9F7
MPSSYYQGLSADFSRPNLVSAEQGQALLVQASVFLAQKEETLPQIDERYTKEQIEAENKDWWPTHCEALRRGRGDLLHGEYRIDLVYFCQDGPFYGLEQQNQREKHWWALISQPGVTMCWPIVMFSGEFVHFEWYCQDDESAEVVAKGTVLFVRRGHRGACYFKSEQLTFYRDVFASPRLLELLTTT